MTEIEMLASIAAAGIVTTSFEHDPVFTVEDSADLHARLLGLHTKNLFLKDAGGTFWLVTVPATTRVDLKALAPVLGSKKLSFGKSDDMARLLGVSPGAVTPLSACNDTDCQVTIVLDRMVADAAIVNVHPLRNTATLALAGDDLLKALQLWNHAAQIIDVPARLD